MKCAEYRMADQFYPHTLEEITTVASNFATIVTAMAGVGFGVLISLKLSLSVQFQRRTAMALEASRPKAQSGKGGDGVHDAILNWVGLWADRSKFYTGVSSDALKRMSPAERREYTDWVARLIPMIDVVFLGDAPVSAANEAQIRSTLSQHLAALRAEKRFDLKNIAASDHLRSLIRETLSGRAG